jgi:hypothetical protein
MVRAAAAPLLLLDLVDAVASGEVAIDFAAHPMVEGRP